MKVKTFKKLIVNMGKYKEKVFLVVLEIRKGYFFYRDETGEIQEEVIDLTDLATNEVGDFVFDNYIAKQEKFVFSMDFIISGSESMIDLALDKYFILLRKIYK